MGILNYRVEPYGNVAAIQVIDPDDDLILISSNGVIIRIHADSIRVCSRPAKGVLLMRVGEGNRVVTVARTTRSDEEETAQPEDDGSAEEGGATEEEIQQEAQEPEMISEDENTQE
jgi:DNA gyrase subunit A